jgi:hypothetical protein
MGAKIKNYAICLATTKSQQKHKEDQCTAFGLNP